MSKIVFIAIAALSVCVVFVLLLIWRSPEGHENKAGYHPGSADDAPDSEAANQAKPGPRNSASIKPSSSAAVKK